MDTTSFNASPYILEQTCQACPEQYDVYNEQGEQIAYLRLRHGYFKCEVPSVFGTIVYDSTPNGDGIFTDEERPVELQKAIEAIKDFYSKHTLESTLEQYKTKQQELFKPSQ